MEEPGTNGTPVAFIRAVGKSMTSAACPVPACRGENACSKNGRVFIGCSLSGSTLPEPRDRIPPPSGYRLQPATAHVHRFPRSSVHLRAQKSRPHLGPPRAPSSLARPPPYPSRMCASAAEQRRRAEPLRQGSQLDLDTRCLV